ncbi:MAG: anaerobic ribonucleoside-triphosphate reductase activating protein [Burkholderiales bacterium]|nr:anaerobic ribonucleoside-triphosphate reductase activating protein [Burkholderiales bacterium]MDE2286783.1 anaerobic ribonucleoside-triphosphate reductase activating protein [Burkholderiales bacterium]MDE2610399.1 anaerobic ribonucleoside-triphosphate reductase activating protein [Burkholderiales bacterium]
MSGLRVGGLVPLTSIDFPGHLAAVVFCQGCAWRCVYCHNAHLIPADTPAERSWDDVLAFLGRRRGLLDGVVFSGGEPTLQAALPEAAQAVRDLGMRVALHSAGMAPERLAAVLPLVDWVGLDIKAPVIFHEGIVGVARASAKVMESLRLIQQSGIDYECRTTWHPALFPESELLALGDALALQAVRAWSVQACRLPGIAGPPMQGLAERLAGPLAGRFERFTIRES